MTNGSLAPSVPDARWQSRESVILATGSRALHPAGRQHYRRALGIGSRLENREVIQGLPLMFKPILSIFGKFFCKRKVDRPMRN